MRLFSARANVDEDEEMFYIRTSRQADPESKNLHTVFNIWSHCMYRKTCAKRKSFNLVTTSNKHSHYFDGKQNKDNLYLSFSNATNNLFCTNLCFACF